MLQENNIIRLYKNRKISLRNSEIYIVLVLV
nr:MAG TPA_asm: hypothetical protein [Bacteriophage sp.]